MKQTVTLPSTKSPEGDRSALKGQNDANPEGKASDQKISSFVPDFKSKTNKTLPPISSLIDKAATPLGQTDALSEEGASNLGVNSEDSCLDTDPAQLEEDLSEGETPAITPSNAIENSVEGGSQH